MTDFKLDDWVSVPHPSWDPTHARVGGQIKRIIRDVYYVELVGETPSGPFKYKKGHLQAWVPQRPCP